MTNKIILTLAAIALATGCSSIQTAKNSQGSGDKQIFSAPKEKVWPAMIASVSNTGGAIKEKNQEQCYLLATYGVTAWSWGENVAVFCQEKDTSTEVEVVMEAALKTNVTAVERSPEIFNGITSALSE